MAVCSYNDTLQGPWGKGPKSTRAMTGAITPNRYTLCLPNEPTALPLTDQQKKGTHMRPLVIAALLTGLATSASADITTTFKEGAPKDRFTFTNTGDCALGETKITLDLTGTRGKLVFDVTSSGAGVEVFQPFELVSGASNVTSAPRVSDGDKTLTLSLSALPKGAAVAFTIDVDDTIGAREITVTGSEISGAKVMVETADLQSLAIFDGPQTRVALDCAS